MKSDKKKQSKPGKAKKESRKKKEEEEWGFKEEGIALQLLLPFYFKIIPNPRYLTKLKH